MLPGQGGLLAGQFLREVTCPRLYPGDFDILEGQSVGEWASDS